MGKRSKGKRSKTTNVATNTRTSTTRGDGKAVNRCCFQHNCNNTKNLQACSRCKVALYCSRDHQRENWKLHKSWCQAHLDQKADIEDTTNGKDPTPLNWWRNDHRCDFCTKTHAWNYACNKPPGGGPDEYHEGIPELIVWNFPHSRNQWTDFGPTYWGGRRDEEKAMALKQKFREMGYDQEKLAQHWSGAFRWTCCGASLSSSNPCDHHGSGSKACSCDLCVMGKELPETLKLENVTNYGLGLCNGPDPRSYDSLRAGMHGIMRDAFGMDS